jgi:hypothetical protein
MLHFKHHVNSIKFHSSHVKFFNCFNYSLPWNVTPSLKKLVRHFVLPWQFKQCWMRMYNEDFTFLCFFIPVGYGYLTAFLFSMPLGSTYHAKTEAERNLVVFKCRVSSLRGRWQMWMKVAGPKVFRKPLTCHHPQYHDQKRERRRLPLAVIPARLQNLHVLHFRPSGIVQGKKHPSLG